MSSAGGVLATVLTCPCAGVPTGYALSRADGEPPVTVPRDPARDAARRELSRRMYHENDPGLLRQALDAFWEWVGRLLGAASSAAPGGGLGLLVIVLAAVALLGALWWRLGSPRRAPASAVPLFDDRPRSAAEHRAAAEAHAARSHWDQAVQERMRAVVRSLEERALLDPRAGRTADEAAAEAARSLPGHTGRLRAAARDFDDVAYGGRTAAPDTYHRLAQLDGDLERARPALAHSGPGTAHSHHQGGAG